MNLIRGIIYGIISCFQGNSCTCPINDDSQSKTPNSEAAQPENLNLPFSTGKVNHEEDTTDKLSSQIYVNQGKKLAGFIQTLFKICCYTLLVLLVLFLLKIIDLQ